LTGRVQSGGETDRQLPLQGAQQHVRAGWAGETLSTGMRGVIVDHEEASTLLISPP
jgi:hypothetical protein